MMKKDSFIILTVVLLLLVYSTITTCLYIQSKNSFSVISPEKLWNKYIVNSYFDEPNFGKKWNLKITSSTGWIIPSNPDVVTSDNNLLSYTSMTNDQKSKINKDWKDSFDEDSKIPFEKLNLQGMYRDALYYSEIVPINVVNSDIIGNGKSEKIIIGVGMGCISCHAEYIEIFYNNKVYFTNSFNGIITPRLDHKGFYLSSEEYNTFTPYSDPPDGVVISKYQWNGVGFTEIARKTEKLKKL